MNCWMCEYFKIKYNKEHCKECKKDNKKINFKLWCS